jgi:hypothetical protein
MKVRADAVRAADAADKPKTHDWLFSIGGWNVASNADGSRGTLWQTKPMTNLDLDPAKVAEDIARDRVIQADTLLCLTEIATGRRYEVSIKAAHVITHNAIRCVEVGR